MRKTLLLLIVFQTLITTVLAEENKHSANTGSGRFSAAQQYAG